MAGRLFRTLACFKYRNGLPALRLKLMNYMGETKETELVVDTGFSGGVLLPWEEYEFFLCGELPRSLWRSYLTLVGRVPMRTARAIAIVEEVNARFEVYVETPLYGRGKKLLGREVINKLTLLLEGPESTCCICQEEEHFP